MSCCTCITPVALAAVLLGTIAVAPAAQQAVEEDATASVLGTWHYFNERLDRTTLLELKADQTGWWIRIKDGFFEDIAIRWARHGDWIGFAAGQSAFELKPAGDEMLVTPLSPGVPGVNFKRTDTPDHLQLIPGHGPPPEPADAKPSAVGIWSNPEAGEGGAGLVGLNADGTGTILAMDPTTAIGTTFRWTREGDTISLSTREGRAFQLLLERDALRVPGAGGKFIGFVRSDDALHAQLLASPVSVVEPPRSKENPKEQEAYYRRDATEAVLLFGGPEIFTIGREDLAPPEVQRWLTALREAARPRIEQLQTSNIELTISPNGRSVIIDGFRRGDYSPLSFIWHDWRKADAVEENKLFFRVGLFLSDRYLYLGERQLLDRETGLRCVLPDVSVLRFDVTHGGRWVGLQDYRQMVRIGTLGTPDFSEFELETTAGKPFWTNGGSHFVIDMPDGVAVYDTEGTKAAGLDGPDWRLGPQIADHRFFVSRGFAQAAMMTVGEDGGIELTEVRQMKCRADRVSPSGKFVLGLGDRETGDRWDIDRTPLAEPDEPLPPRPPYAYYWIAWGD